MTELLERAVGVARTLPASLQDDIARMVLELAGEKLPPLQLTPEEEASFRDSLGEAERGEFATDEEIRAIWAKHGL